MAFNINAWTQISVSTSSTQVMPASEISIITANNGAPNIFAYTSSTDLIETIVVDNYFNQVVFSLKVGDVIFLSALDGTQILEVNYVRYNGNNTIVQTNPQGAAGWFSSTVYIPPDAVQNLNNAPYVLVFGSAGYIISCVSCILSLHYPQGVVPVPYGNVTNLNTVRVICGSINNTAAIDATGFLDQTNTDVSLSTNGFVGGFIDGVLNRFGLIGQPLRLESADTYTNGNATLVASVLYTKTRLTKP